MDLAQQEELEGRFRIARTIKIIEYARDIWYKQPMNTVSAWESALLEAKKKMEGMEQLQNDLSKLDPTLTVEILYTGPFKPERDLYFAN